MSYPEPPEDPTMFNQQYHDQEPDQPNPWYKQPAVLIALAGAGVAVVAVIAALIITRSDDKPAPAGNTSSVSSTTSSTPHGFRRRRP